MMHWQSCLYIASLYAKVIAWRAIGSAHIYEGFASARRMLSGARAEAVPIVFANTCVEVAGYVGRGLDRIVAIDELKQIAEAYGLFDDDDVQRMIATAFAKVPRTNGPEQQENIAPPAGDFVIDRSSNDWWDSQAIVKRWEQADKGKGNGREQFKPALAFPIDVEQLPERPWIVPGLLMRRQVTLLIAPPGSGKSLLTLQIGLMCAAPLREWAGWRPRQVSHVLFINAEEDGEELQRRLWAAAKVMQIDQEVLRAHVYLADNPNDIVIANYDNRTRTVMPTPMMDKLIAGIRELHIDVLIVDPFAETFRGDENSNSEVKWAAMLWRDVARSCNCAVLLVHHTRKFSNSENAGDMDVARGGGSLLGVARMVHTLFPMSDKEAGTLLDDAEERHRYLRFDDAKANLSLITPRARWFYKQTIQLPLHEGSPDDQPADEIGVLVPWKRPDAFEGISTEEVNRILDSIDRGVEDNAGNASGNWFMHWRTGRKPKFWVGDVIMEARGCNQQEAKSILQQWFKHNLLETFTAVTPQLRGHASDNNVRSVKANRPGIISHDEL
jgi:hypothetical protein